MRREGSAVVFSHFKEPVKLVYIDGSHDYESVKVDIETALKLLVAGGVMCGHDADAPGVRQAIGEAFEREGTAMIGHDGNCGMWRSSR